MKQQTITITIDDAWCKKQVCAPMFEPEAFRKHMYCIEESAYDIVVTFWSPAVIWHQGNCAPLPPLVTPLVMCNKNRKNSENNQLFNSVDCLWKTRSQ